MGSRLGAYFPGTSGAKFFGGETQLTAGLDYSLSSRNETTPSSTDAYFDYMGGAKNAVRLTNGTNNNRTGPDGKFFVGMGLGRNSSILFDYHI